MRSPSMYELSDMYELSENDLDSVSAGRHEVNRAINVVVNTSDQTIVNDNSGVIVWANNDQKYPRL